MQFSCDGPAEFRQAYAAAMSQNPDILFVGAPEPGEFLWDGYASRKTTIGTASAPDAAATLEALHGRYAGDALDVDDLDGYSFEFPNWRFNIRMSNTEPVVRLNIETRGDQELLAQKTKEVLSVLEADIVE